MQVCNSATSIGRYALNNAFKNNSDIDTWIYDLGVRWALVIPTTIAHLRHADQINRLRWSSGHECMKAEAYLRASHVQTSTAFKYDSLMKLQLASTVDCIERFSWVQTIRLCSYSNRLFIGAVRILSIPQSTVVPCFDTRQLDRRLSKQIVHGKCAERETAWSASWVQILAKPMT